MFKEQTMIQLQYPKTNPGAKLHKTQRQRPSSSTHSVVENSAIHYSALFTAHPSDRGLHIPQHKLTLPRYTSKAAPTPVYTTATLPPSISHMQENNKKNDLKAIAGEKKRKEGEGRSTWVRKRGPCATAGGPWQQHQQRREYASAEAAQQAPAPRTHNVPEGVGRTAVSAAAQPQSKKEQTALSLQSKSKRMLVHRRSGRCTKNTYQNRLRLSPHTSAGTGKRQYQLASLGALATRGRAPTCPTQAQSRGACPGLQMPLNPADSLVG
eukprot:gene9232-6485_t